MTTTRFGDYGSTPTSGSLVHTLLDIVYLEPAKQWLHSLASKCSRISIAATVHQTPWCVLRVPWTLTSWLNKSVLVVDHGSAVRFPEPIHLSNHMKSV